MIRMSISKGLKVTVRIIIDVIVDNNHRNNHTDGNSKHTYNSEKLEFYKYNMILMSKIVVPEYRQ